jgi:hypothetical protein
VWRLHAIALSLLAAACCAAPAQAGPLGWSDPVTVARPGGSDVRTTATAVARDGSSRIAWAEANGAIASVRVAASGQVGAIRTVATGQGGEVRGLQMVATDRDEFVLVWATGTSLRYAAAHNRELFQRVHTFAHVGSYTSATPDIAALHGGTVAAIWRDFDFRRRDVVRYARRAPGRSFGTAHALRAGVYPQVEPTPDGGAVVAMEIGPIGHRTSVVASARRGAPAPGAFASVAGGVRFHRLASSRRARSVVLLWTTREQTPRVRARQVWPRVGTAYDVPGGPHPATFEAPQLGLGYAGEAIAAWPQYDNGYFDVASHGSPGGGPWSSATPLETQATGETGQAAIVFRPAGGAFVLYQSTIRQPGPVADQVVVVDPGQPAPVQAGALGPATSLGGLSSDWGGGAQLAAWPAPGGVSITFRRD